MSYRKGERTFRMNERDFPHIAEIDIPEGGLKERLMDMHEWHRAHGIESYRGGGSINVVRWCFADADKADSFAAEFGARRLLAHKPKPRDPYDFRP